MKPNRDGLPKISEKPLLGRLAQRVSSLQTSRFVCSMGCSGTEFPVFSGPTIKGHGSWITPWADGNLRWCAVRHRQRATAITQKWQAKPVHNKTASLDCTDRTADSRTTAGDRKSKGNLATSIERQEMHIWVQNSRYRANMSKHTD